MSWSMSDIEKLANSGKIKGYHIPAIGKMVKSEKKPPQTEPTGLKYIKQCLEKEGIDYVTEWQFAKPRKFRFDVAVIPFNLAVEYEGTMSKKSRHTTVTGYAKDAEKYNIAQIAGWRVLRYTAINYKQFEVDLKTILTNKSKI